jgi:hypothetical protein
MFFGMGFADSHSHTEDGSGNVFTGYIAAKNIMEFLPQALTVQELSA